MPKISLFQTYVFLLNNPSADSSSRKTLLPNRNVAEEYHFNGPVPFRTQRTQIPRSPQFVLFRMY